MSQCGTRPPCTPQMTSFSFSLSLEVFIPRSLNAELSPIWRHGSAAIIPPDNWHRKMKRCGLQAPVFLACFLTSVFRGSLFVRAGFRGFQPRVFAEVQVTRNPLRMWGKVICFVIIPQSCLVAVINSDTENFLTRNCALDWGLSYLGN